MNIIKVGTQRVVVDNVTHVDERISKKLKPLPSGELFEAIHDTTNVSTGLVVTVNFISGDAGDYVRFYLDEAEEFLAKFDAIAAQQSPTANPLI